MKRGYLHALLVTIFAVALSASLRADDVVIENRGQRTFYYALRANDDTAWSKTYDLAPGEKQSHVTSDRLRISYLSDNAQFAWLEAKRVYRIDDVTKGRLRAVTQVRRPALPAATPDAASDSSATRGPADLSGPAAATENADPAATAVEAAAVEPGVSSQPAAPTKPDASARPSQPIPTSPLPTSPRGPSTYSDRTDETFDGLFDITNRVVTVRVITDNTYRNAFPEWRERVRGIISGASDYYQRKYSIRLVVTETSEWKYDAVDDDLQARWERLLEQSPHDVDLIIALVGYGDYSSVEGEPAFTGQLGRAAFFGQHLMVADRQDYHVNRAKTILIHELGHIFGAFHVADQNLMMYPGYLQLPTAEIIAGTVPFGETMDTVISMTKGFAFRDGVNSLSPATQRRIQTLYRQHGLATESRETDPITSGYKYLARRAKIVADQMAERATAARGVFDGLSE